MKGIKFYEIIAAVLMLSLTVLAGISCAKANTDKFEGVTWVLKSYGNPYSPALAITEREPTVTFNEEKKEVSGNGGVNGYGGDYEVNGNKLTVSGVIYTLMASTNEALNKQESTFFKILNSAQSFYIDGKQLTITGTEGMLAFLEK